MGWFRSTVFPGWSVVSWCPGGICLTALTTTALRLQAIGNQVLKLATIFLIVASRFLCLSVVFGPAFIHGHSHAAPASPGGARRRQSAGLAGGAAFGREWSRRGAAVQNQFGARSP